MREIKFRAWHYKQKKMYSAYRMGEDELTINPDGRGFVNVSGIDTRESQYITAMIPMQYIGLDDKIGSEIYDADIIERQLNEKIDIAVVVFIERHSMYAWQLIKNFKDGITDGNYDMFDKKTVSSNIGWEVIGNIHENPELLKK